MEENKNLELYEVLDRAGVASLAKALLDVVNARIGERIVTEISETSDNNHVASALAVYNAIVKNSHISMKTYTGPDINDITEPSATTIYLQRDDESDTTWMMYVHDAEVGWIAIGDTAIDLSGYWSKTDEDKAALKELLGIPAIQEEIADIKTDLSNKVNKDQIVALTEGEILAIIAQADIKTANQMVKVGNVFYSDLAAAVASAEDGCVTLTKDISLQNRIQSNKPVTIDLAGKTMTVANNGVYGLIMTDGNLTLKNGNITCSANNGVVDLKGNATLQLENVHVTGANTVFICAENDSAVTVDAASVLEDVDRAAIMLYGNARLDLYGTVKSQNYYPIGGNGSSGVNTTMNIYPGSHIEVTGMDTPAIYHPGKGTLNITGGEILSTCTAIEMRAGVLNMSGGYVLGNKDNALTEATCKPNGSGTCTEGPAIAVIQHNTKYPITVNITGGKVESTVGALYEKNIQPGLPAPVLNFGISGDAQVIGPVSVENAANFISGGVFTPQPNEAYLAAGKRFAETEGKFTVQDA